MSESCTSIEMLQMTHSYRGAGSAKHTSEATGLTSMAGNDVCKMCPHYCSY